VPVRCIPKKRKRGKRGKEKKEGEIEKKKISPCEMYQIEDKGVAFS